jgi:hypothetical protein
MSNVVKDCLLPGLLFVSMGLSWCSSRSCLHHLGATTTLNDFLRQGPFRPEEDGPPTGFVVVLVFSSWGKTGRPVKEDVFIFEDSWVVHGFQQGLVFWSKAEMLVESDFGEASKEGEIGR